MSSMCWAVWANSSLTSMPLWPYFWNLNGEGNAAPVLRSVRQVRHRQLLAGVFCKRRLGIERIDVARPAVHEQVDDALGLGRKMRQLVRPADSCSPRPARPRWLRGQQRSTARIGQDPGEAEHGEAHAGAAEQFAASESVFSVAGVLCHTTVMRTWAGELPVDCKSIASFWR